MVCTANVCRSPMAAAILQHHLDAQGIDAVVTSAGTMGPNGLPVDPEAVAAVSKWGIDLRAHQPRLFTKDVGAEEGADLIITMERQHLRHVVALDRRTWVRTYTLKELIRRIANAGPMAPGNLAVWTSALSTGRRRWRATRRRLLRRQHGAGQQQGSEQTELRSHRRLLPGKIS